MSLHNVDEKRKKQNYRNEKRSYNTRLCFQPSKSTVAAEECTQIKSYVVSIGFVSTKFFEHCNICDGSNLVSNAW